MFYGKDNGPNNLYSKLRKLGYRPDHNKTRERKHFESLNPFGIYIMLALDAYGPLKQAPLGRLVREPFDTRKGSDVGTQVKRCVENHLQEMGLVVILEGEDMNVPCNVYYITELGKKLIIAINDHHFNGPKH